MTLDQILAQRSAILSVALWNLYPLSQSLRLNTIHDMSACFKVRLNSTFTDHPAIRRHIIWATDSVTHTHIYIIYPNNLLFFALWNPIYSSVFTNNEKGPQTQHLYFSFHVYHFTSMIYTSSSFPLGSFSLCFRKHISLMAYCTIPILDFPTFSTSSALPRPLSR
jgi:hypothetical protein